MRSSGLLEIDRKVSVAPMMDWADGVEFACQIIHLAATTRACRLFVSSQIPQRAVCVNAPAQPRFRSALDSTQV